MIPVSTTAPHQVLNSRLLVTQYDIPFARPHALRTFTTKVFSLLRYVAVVFNHISPNHSTQMVHLMHLSKYLSPVCNNPSIPVYLGATFPAVSGEQGLSVSAVLALPVTVVGVDVCGFYNPAVWSDGIEHCGHCVGV